MPGKEPPVLSPRGCQYLFLFLRPGMRLHKGPVAASSWDRDSDIRRETGPTVISCRARSG